MERRNNSARPARTTHKNGNKARIAHKAGGSARTALEAGGSARTAHKAGGSARTAHKAGGSARTAHEAENTKINEREVVLSILTEIRTKDVYSHVAVRTALDRLSEEGVPASHRAFIKRLAEGTIERQIELDDIVRDHMTHGGRPIKPVLRDILRLAVYQIYYMDSVPDSAACNEAVKMARNHHLHALTGFVNGVLRNIVRDKEKSVAGNSDVAAQNHKPLSVRYSMPDWLVKMWTESYGEEQTEALLASLLAIRPVSIRVDERLSEDEREKLIDQIAECGVKVEAGKYLPYSYTLTGTSAIKDLPGFREGKWSVQDESSMFVAEAADVKPGQTVFDICSAPGGKTIHAASKLKVLEAAAGAGAGKGRKGGKVFAYDLSPVKIKQIQYNIDRTHLNNVQAAVRDARIHDPALDSKADVLLCDVPCSGLGVIGKKRDIKYHATPEKIHELTELQKKIMRASLPILKPGGTLIYSTCTINKSENEDMALWLEKEMGLEPVSLAPVLPGKVLEASGSSHSGSGDGEGRVDHMLQLLPSVHGTDGFFLAKFRKPVEK